MQNPVTCPHCSASFQSDQNGAVATCPTCAKPISVGTPAMGVLAAPRSKASRNNGGHRRNGTAPNAAPQPSGQRRGAAATQRIAPVGAGFAPPPGQKKSIGLLLLALCVAALFVLLGLGGVGAIGLAYVLSAPPGSERKDSGEGYAELDQATPKPTENEKPTSPVQSNPATPVAYPKPVSQQPVEIKPTTTAGTSPVKPVDLPPEFKPIKRTKRKPKSNLESGYRSSLSKQHQKMVNRAIDDGVAWLRQQQAKNGSWPDKTWPVGYTALTGLTLLECGAKTNDPAVQKAARYLRFNAQKLKRHSTYQMSLVILFLDRLGEKQDHNLIRRLAARLIAGQTVAGGWNYTCPELTYRENMELINFLHKTRPLPILLVKEGPNPNETPLPKGGGGDLPSPIGKSGKDLPTPISGKDDPKNKTGDGNKKKSGGLILPFPGNSNGKKPPAQKKQQSKKNNNPANPNGGNPPAPPAPFPVHTLSKKIRELPIVQQKPLPNAPLMVRRNRKKFRLRTGRDDNSNTQFAMLALWAARRYGIPVERTLALVDERFDASQQANGGWGYMFRLKQTSPQMTCVGLIGLGIGHGAYKEAYGNAWNGKNKAAGKAKEDRRIQDGLKHLGRFVGKAPADWAKKSRQSNLYFLWSLERTAMMYNLKTLGGRDWYAWAAQMLVSNQHPEGNWSGGGYHRATPTLDTCMALLVLRRANLTEDLTESLQLLIPIVDPDARK